MPHLCTDCDRRFDDGSKEMLSGCPDCGGNKFQFIPDGADATGADDADQGTPPEQTEPPEPPEPAVDSSVARTVGNAATAVRDLVSSGPSAPPESPGAESTSSAATIEDDAQASARSEIVDPRELPSTSGSSMGTAAGLSSVDRQPTVDDARSRSDRTSPESVDERRQQPSAADSTPDDAVAQDKPELDDLREELNQQFESIRVLEPGQYELNLMELYDREEYIIALQEDGKYTIQVPERWEDA